MDEAAGAIVELEPSVLAKFHDAGGGEALRMRGDAKAMVRGQRRAGAQIDDAEGLLQYDLAADRRRDDAAGLLGVAQLEFDPAWNIIERRRQPWLHRGHRAGPQRPGRPPYRPELNLPMTPPIFPAKPFPRNVNEAVTAT